MVLACSHSRSLQLLARLDTRTEFEILEHSLEGGVEAGRAHHCIQAGKQQLRVAKCFSEAHEARRVTACLKL